MRWALAIATAGTKATQTRQTSLKPGLHMGCISGRGEPEMGELTLGESSSRGFIGRSSLLRRAERSTGGTSQPVTPNLKVFPGKVM